MAEEDISVSHQCQSASTTANNRDSKETVDELVRAIEQNFKGFNVSEIIKAGSLGHGTAVPACFDIDLVIYSRDISGADILRDGFKTWLEQLESFIQRTYHTSTEIKLAPYSRRVRSVKFTYGCDAEPIDVDLFVSPYWEEASKFYDFLTTVPRRKQSMFYDCAAKWQVQFSKNIEKQVIKEYIKRIKAWRNQTWQPGMNGRPKSYLITLLVVRAYELARENKPGGDPKPADVKAELVDLVKHSGPHLDVYWADQEGDNYRRRDYSRLLPSRPRVIDPANPTRNVWATGFDMLNYRPGKRIKGGKSKFFKQKIDTLNLSKLYYDNSD